MTDAAVLLLALEQDLWRANRDGDADFYRANLTDDALLVSRFGIASKSAVVPMIAANRNPFVRTELSGQQVRFLGPTSALVTYRADYTARVDGADVDLSVLATTVYVERDGRWLVALHQQTPLGS
ncbi:nuclear transport factor 2 family protein [Dactylosporangium sp. NPDC000555]|uniref:nuclear transport factor 2 family protein n=1 Tax=Dactylosporangium sp. NPDC000555 TaxID=3154260 RepID=UPI003316FC41